MEIIETKKRARKQEIEEENSRLYEKKKKKKKKAMNESFQLFLSTSIKGEKRRLSENGI